MAVKSTDNPGMTKGASSTASTPETPPAPAGTTTVQSAAEALAEQSNDKMDSERQAKIDARECVVETDFHVGRATPGSLVCSYHAMHYNTDGSRRQ